jgi:hypothetical protein
VLETWEAMSQKPYREQSENGKDHEISESEMMDLDFIQKTNAKYCLTSESSSKGNRIPAVL